MEKRSSSIIIVNEFIGSRGRVMSRCIAQRRKETKILHVAPKIKLMIKKLSNNARPVVMKTFFLPREMSYHSNSSSFRRRNVKHGVDLNKLQGWQQRHINQELSKEEARQELALMRMKTHVISNGKNTFPHHEGLFTIFQSDGCSTPILVQNVES
jgi:hypothetical protein